MVNLFSHPIDSLQILLKLDSSQKYSLIREKIQRKKLIKIQNPNSTNRLPSN